MGRQAAPQLQPKKGRVEAPEVVGGFRVAMVGKVEDEEVERDGVCGPDTSQVEGT